MSKDIVVAVTGASGSPYAKRLIECLAAAEVKVHLIVSPHGRQVLFDELDGQAAQDITAGRAVRSMAIYECDDVGCKLASGSFHTDGMIVCPCSSNTLAGIAAGLGDNLITRAAQVTLKESRRLVLVPREMPITHIDIENMLRASQAGAIICPASPGFYMRPTTVEELVDFVVARALDLLRVSHTLNVRWAGKDRQVRSDGLAAVC